VAGSESRHLPAGLWRRRTHDQGLIRAAGILGLWLMLDTLSAGMNTALSSHHSTGRAEVRSRWFREDNSGGFLVLGGPE
jgi:hypothetical protein